MRRVSLPYIVILLLGCGLAYSASAGTWRASEQRLECRKNATFPEAREVELLLLKRLHFAQERRQTASELAGSLRELRSGARKRAFAMTAGFSVVFSALGYEGMILLARHATQAAWAPVHKAGQWAATSLNSGSTYKFLLGDAVYETARTLLAEKVAILSGPDELKWIQRVGTESMISQLPRQLELSPRGLETAYEELGEQHARLELYEKKAAPKPRDRRDPITLGWDDYMDFKILFELADAKRRLYDLEVGITRHLLGELRDECRSGSPRREFLVTEQPHWMLTPSEPISTLRGSYSPPPSRKSREPQPIKAH